MTIRGSGGLERFGGFEKALDELKYLHLAVGVVLKSITMAHVALKRIRFQLL